MTTPAEKQVDVFKAGMSLANLVNYSNQLIRLCQCPVCTFVHKETKKWSVWCSKSAGKNLQVLMDQRCYFYQRCNNLQAYILEEIFEIVSKTHNIDREVTFVAHKLSRVFPNPEDAPDDIETMPTERPQSPPPPPLPRSPTPPPVPTVPMPDC